MNEFVPANEVLRSQAEWFNLTEVGRILGCERHTVGKMCDRGELLGIPRGRKGRRVPRWSLVRLLRGGGASDPVAQRRAVDGRTRSNRKRRKDTV